MKTFSAKLRDRQHLRRLNKEKLELIGPTLPRDDTRERLAWPNTQLSRAVKNNDHAEIERLVPICHAAREEFKLLCGKEETR